MDSQKSLIPIPPPQDYATCCGSEAEPYRAIFVRARISIYGDLRGADYPTEAEAISPTGAPEEGPEEAQKRREAA